ncbi:hypothetical protein HDU87_001518 [Geranomyces variabilis]|uniref:Uncharacterized protein n=1 Tax=Geranomyces variabilis TaxID=109894 RepID=A0AAD5TDG1_9FUNG|nr:hypothetical protein HDU87_001518 [Geranomyces variabilis]
MGCVSSKSPTDSNKVVPVSAPPAGDIAKTAPLGSTDAAPIATVQAAYPAQSAATTSKPLTPPNGGGSGPVDRIKSAEKLPLGSRSSLDKPLMPPIPSTATPATSSAAAAAALPPPSLTSSQQNVSAMSGPAAALAAAAAKRNGSGNKVHPDNGQNSQTEAAAASSSKPGSAGSDSYVPVYSKAAEGPLKPVAFEIPLGETLFTAPSWKQSADVKLSTSTVPKLPSLQGLTSDAIAAKLANADRRWKDLDDHEIARKKSTRRRRAAGAKPELSSSSRPKTRGGSRPDNNNISSSTAIAASAADPETDDQLKLRLLEKEAHAERNRKKELEKLTAKLRRMDQHVRSVQERKRVLERGDSEDEVVMSVSGSTQSLVV